MIPSVDQAPRFGLSHLAGQPGDGLCRYLADLLCPFGRVVDDFILKLFEANSLGFNKSLVVQFFFDHHVYHGEKEGQVRPGFDRQPFISQDGCLAVPRVHHDHLCSLSLCFRDFPDLGEIDSTCRIPADNHDVSGIREVIRGKFPDGRHPTRVPGRVTGRAMTEIVRTPEGVH